MSDNYDIGFGKPPKANQWNKGQSGNPKGRPKTRTDLVKDAAAILSEPVTARTPEGGRISLDGFEASYLALCKKGFQGHVPSLIAAIKIMLDVQPIVDAREENDKHRREEVLASLEKMGVWTGGIKK